MEFSKGVHEYLGHSIDLADAKSAILLGLASGLLGFTLNQHNYPCLSAFVLIAELLVVISAGVSLFSLFPRLYSSGKGLIFWEDILSRQSSKAYVEEAGMLSQTQIENEYSEQNYQLSKILHCKYLAIRWAMMTLILGALVLLPTLI